MYSCSPTNARQIVDPVGEREILVPTITLAVVVAASMLVFASSRPPGDHSLEKLAIPEVVSAQHRADIVATDKD